MNILLTGATGYIGGAIAEALSAAGHDVTGLARSDEKAAELQSRGLWVARGDLRDPASLARAAREVDAVIHTAMAWAPDAGLVDRAAVEAMLGALAQTSKPFVYTSGVWVLGSTFGRIAGELAPLSPPPLVAWRPAVERLVQDAVEQHVRSVVIRPAMVYGRGKGTAVGFLHSARTEGVVRIAGDGSNHWSFVHADDLADLYRRAVEQPPAGELFLATDGRFFTVREVAEGAIRAAGVPARLEFLSLEEARARMGPIADGLMLDQKAASTKAGRILGWVARKPSVLEDLAG